MTAKTTKRKAISKSKPRQKPSAQELKRRYERFLELQHKWKYEDNPEEQRETGAFLMKALAEARESNREPKT